MTKISQYTAITTLANGDLMDISEDVGAGLYQSKKITYQDFLAMVQADITFPPTSAYFKAEVTIATGVGGAISGSLTDEPVNTLSYTITQDGDYVFYAMVSVDIENQDAKPFSIMLYKNGVKENDSLTMDFAKKSEQQSIQLTFPIDSLVIGDVIQVYINNDNIDVDSLVLGRIVAQSWG
tara:strand:+ start:640 stop:1179 length:540 start_codon:yes stop_codon:yes gene_type:complete